LAGRQAPWMKPNAPTAVQLWVVVPLLVPVVVAVKATAPVVQAELLYTVPVSVTVPEVADTRDTHMDRTRRDRRRMVEEENREVK